MNCLILFLIFIIILIIVLSVNCNRISECFENLHETAKELPYVENLNKNLKICVFMIATPEIENYSEFTIKQNSQWCKIHNYDFKVFDKKHNKVQDLPINFSKIQYTLDILDTKLYDYVIYIDADAIVHNMKYDIRNLIQKEMKMLTSSLFGEDCYDRNICSKPGRINSGVFITKNNFLGKETMKLWLKASRGKCSKYINQFPNCQNVFTHCVFPKLWFCIKIIPFNVMNGFGDTLLIKHAMAMDDVQRISELKKHLIQKDERIRIF